MNPNEPHLAEQVSELRWLVYELGHEKQALEATPYPQVHRLLLHSLATKIAQVAETICTVTCTPVTPEHSREEVSHASSTHA